MGGIFGGGDEEVTTRSSSGPPEWALPYVQDFMSSVEPLRDQASTFYPGQTYAGMSDQRQAGLAGMQGLAQQGGTGNIQAGNQYLGDVLGGKYLQSPELAQASQMGIDRMAPGIASAFALQGRDGSGLAADALGQGVASVVNQNYGRERQMQQGALSMVPQFENMAYQPYQMLNDVGRQYEGQEQLGINEAMARHDFAQQEPWQRAAKYGNLLGSGSQMWGSEGSDTHIEKGSSPFQSILGLGATALGTYFGGPMGGSLAGGIAGGMGGGGSMGMSNTGGSNAMYAPRSGGFSFNPWG